MKKVFALLILICLCLCLTGCDDDKTEETVTATATPKPTVAATAAPTATPIPVLNANEYVMQWKNDADRGMNYMVPTHWVSEAAGERYIVFLEPVPDGESGFRVSYTNKKKSSEPDTSKMKVEFKNLISEMQKVYTDFEWSGTISRDYKFTNFVGYHSEYTFTDDNGTAMHGFVIIATYNRRIYCMNFNGPEDRWVDMKTIMLKMMDNVTRIA